VRKALTTVRDLASREQELAYGEDSEKDGAKMAWQAWLGFYNSHTKKLNLNKEQLVQMSAEYARAMGLPQLPAIQKQTIGKMGLQVQYLQLLIILEPFCAVFHLCPIVIPNTNATFARMKLFLFSSKFLCVLLGSAGYPHRGT
jgi:hypothetical protein